MKGIILAGGSGSRLAPLTNTTSKQLLPVYDKPMIYYPLSTMIDLGVRDILIISTSRDLPKIEELLGDGSRFGTKLNYQVQEKPNGIAECFLIAGEFVDDPVALILGDNIFVLDEELPGLRAIASMHKLDSAQILLCPVKDPERFGVAECDEDGRVIRLVEKPPVPISNLASVGLYFYPEDVTEKVRALKPSARGELEITDLNNVYLNEGRLRSLRMNEKSKWLDAGTPDSLLESSVMMAQEYHKRRNPTGYVEALALRRGLIDETTFEQTIWRMKPGTPYREHLRNLVAVASMRDE